MRAYARRNGEDEELWGVAGLLHDVDYERHPDLGDGPSARWPGRARGAATSTPWSCARSPRTPTSSASRATRRWRRRCSPSTSSRASSSPAPTCGPEGIHGLTPKSVKKKLKQPSFAAAVNRDEVRDGAEELGVDFDEHVAFVIAALEERADELGLHGRDAASTG